MENHRVSTTPSPVMVSLTVCCSIGGLVVFCKKGDGQYEVKSIHTEPLSLVLVDTMLPKNTARMIEKVGALRSTLPTATEHLFDTIESLVKEVVSEDNHFDETHFCDAIQVNQGLLCILGVSCDAIDDVVETAARHQHAAKLTGGGGGGCVFAVGRDSSQRALLVQELQNRGYTTQIATIGGKGLCVYCLVSRDSNKHENPESSHPTRPSASPVSSTSPSPARIYSRRMQ